MLFFGCQFRVIQRLFARICRGFARLVARDGQAQRQPPGAVCRLWRAKQ